MSSASNDRFLEDASDRDTNRAGEESGDAAPSDISDTCTALRDAFKSICFRLHFQTEVEGKSVGNDCSWGRPRDSED